MIQRKLTIDFSAVARQAVQRELDCSPSGGRSKGRRRATERWFKNWMALGREIEKAAVDSRSGVELIREERERC
ncbi:MAG: hypothetical protein HY360_25680 [Verrucomicrobia bacterium]|nr:hypothetical protein [Verrucomicrobiota bacterium]